MAILTVSSGTTVIDSSVGSFDEQDVYGTAINAFIASGGEQIVETGGLTTGSTVYGTQIVDSGGSAIDSLVGSGGVQTVESGGSAVAGTLDGGTLDLQPGAVTSGGIIFAGSGSTLRIEGTTMSESAIGGFFHGDEIDLASVHFSQGAKAVLMGDGTLEIKDGGYVYDLSIAGSQDYIGEKFKVGDDGSGGTKVTVAPAPIVYTTIDYPGAIGTDITGINNNGEMIGTYSDASGEHGFTYSGGVFTTLDDPNGDLTYPFGINDLGQIVGEFEDPSGNVVHGFLYSSGAFTTIDYPSVGSGGATRPTAINNEGQIVGTYAINNYVLNNGFLYSGGTFVQLSGQPVSNNKTMSNVDFNGINDAGQIVGTIVGTAAEGFVYNDSSHSYVLLPSEIGMKDINANSINDSGEIIGAYFDQKQRSHSFLYFDGNYTTKFTDGTTTDVFSLSGINQKGEIVGSYYDSLTGLEHGFIAEPPGSVAQLSTAELTGGNETSTGSPIAANMALLRQSLASSFAAQFPGPVLAPSAGALDSMLATLVLPVPT
jgi:autotransporter passenger strand-loop-strand repeat protein/probable HAF family extracellular repeat protein